MFTSKCPPRPLVWGCEAPSNFMTKQFNSPRVKHDILEHSWEVIIPRHLSKVRGLSYRLARCLRAYSEKGGCKLSWFLQDVVSTESDDAVFSFAICSFTCVLT